VSDPRAVLASLYDALEPGGRLVIIEFHRRGLVGLVTRMGIDEADLVKAVSAAGFEVVATTAGPGWPRVEPWALRPHGIMAATGLASAPNVASTRRDGRAVEGGGLENRYTRKGVEGSNPSPSASGCGPESAQRPTSGRARGRRDAFVEGASLL
jgi:hypothetical protein